MLTDQMILETPYLFETCNLSSNQMFCFVSHQHIGMSPFHSAAIVYLKQFDFNKCRTYPSWFKKRGTADAFR